MSDDTSGDVPPDTPSTPDSQSEDEQSSSSGPTNSATEADQVRAENESARPNADEPTTTPASPQNIDKVESSFGWMPRDLLLLCVLAVAVLGFMGWKWASLSGWGAEPIEIERLESRRLDYKIDINTATWVEWVQLPGIGETLAGRIVEDREENGPFNSIDDLQRVKGIGPKKVAGIREHLRVGKPAKSAP